MSYACLCRGASGGGRIWSGGDWRDFICKRLLLSRPAWWSMIARRLEAQHWNIQWTYWSSGPVSAGVENCRRAYVRKRGIKSAQQASWIFSPCIGHDGLNNLLRRGEEALEHEWFEG